MRFNCGRCSYEFSTVRAPDLRKRHVVTDEAADDFIDTCGGSALLGDVIDVRGAFPFWDCPECGSLVFPFGKGGTQNTGQPVETFARATMPEPLRALARLLLDGIGPGGGVYATHSERCGAALAIVQAALAELRDERLVRVRCRGCAREGLAARGAPCPACGDELAAL
jgi:hypothetical protein